MKEEFEENIEMLFYSKPWRIIIDPVASNKSCLLLKIQKSNTQIIQLFTEIIRMESIYKSNQIARLTGLSVKAKWSN